MSRFKTALAAGETLFGVLCGTGSAQIVELSGWLGFDFVLVDMEHGDGLDVGAVLPLIRAADVTGADTIVRVPRFDAGIIQNLLDYGAAGICVPHVQTREDAELAVRATKYPPDGNRAMSPYVRASRYVTSTTWPEFFPLANAETVVMVIVEEEAGLARLDEIAAVPGVDVLWIGTGDLSQSLGVPTDSPRLDAARAQGLAAAKANGLAAYSPILSSPVVDRASRQRQVREFTDQGYTIFGVWDTSIYSAALRELLSAAKG